MTRRQRWTLIPSEEQKPSEKEWKKRKRKRKKNATKSRNPMRKKK